MNQGKLVFSQLMAFLPLTTFRRCVAQHRGDHKVQDFTCMDQFLTMAFAQLTYRDSYAEQAVSDKASQYGASHQQALELIASGNVTHSKEKQKLPLHLPYYLVCSILDAGFAGLQHGISRTDITDKIKHSHHRKDDVRASDMSNLLHNLSTLQHKKGTNPPLIDYDIGKRHLYAIDSTFFFFLRNCDLSQVKDELPSPVESDT